MNKFDYNEKGLSRFFGKDITSMVTLIGIFVTLILGGTTWYSHTKEIDGLQLKERPLACIWYRDFSDSAAIFMENKGIGPMIITNYYL